MTSNKIKKDRKMMKKLWNIVENDDNFSKIHQVTYRRNSENNKIEIKIIAEEKE